MSSTRPSPKQVTQRTPTPPAAEDWKSLHPLRAEATVGADLVQAQVGLLPDESLADGVIRAEALCDLGYPNWRARKTWRRRALLAGRSGALDYPGTSWRDRPAIDQGNDVFLCGDSVAAPSLLSEVSWSSAVTAAEGALRAVGREVIHI